MKKLSTVLILFVMAVAVIFTKPLSASALDSTISWGLNPNTKELTPEPPAGGAEMLKKYHGFFLGNTQEKKVYFTFDLGYEAGYTSKVLDILAENNIKAIFFLCGNYLKQEDLIKRMIDEGHYFGNHTDKHKDLPTLSDADIEKDITTVQDNFRNLYSQPMLFFRPPQGRFNERVLKAALNEGLKTTLWSIAIVDWGKSPINASENANKIEKRLHPGAVILFHITNCGTPEMLKLLIPKIIQKGYKIGSPSEL